MTTKIIGITFHDTKIYFSFFDKTYSNCEKIKPVECAISFVDGKITYFSDALKTKECFTCLTNLPLLKSKLDKNPKAKSVCENEVGCWILFIKKLKEHISKTIQTDCSYFLSIPELFTHQLREILYISFRVNEMNIERIITNEYSSYLGFQSNYFYQKRQEDGSYSGKIECTINLDDTHSTFSTFYVARDKIIKLCSHSTSIGQRYFLKEITTFLHKHLNLQFSEEIDDWDVKYRKKIDAFYGVINAFSEDNVNRTYYRNDDDEAYEVTRDDISKLFEERATYLAAIADKLKKDTELILNNCPKGLEFLKNKKISGLFITGEHKNAIVIRKIEHILNLSVDTTVSQQQVIAEGCGWYGLKHEYKHLSDRNQFNQLTQPLFYERCVDVDALVLANSLLIVNSQNQQMTFPPHNQMLRHGFQMNLTQGTYQVYEQQVYFDPLDGNPKKMFVSIGLVSLPVDGFFVFEMKKHFGFSNGSVSQFSVTEKDWAIEGECQVPARDDELTLTYHELVDERFSNLSGFDIEKDVFLRQGENKFDEIVIEEVAEMKNQFELQSVEQFKSVFNKENAMAKRADEAAKVAADIKQNKLPQLIAEIGQAHKRKATVEMNKLIKACKDDPEELLKGWEALVIRMKTETKK